MDNQMIIPTINAALNEDHVDNDITTSALIPENVIATADIIVKEAGILAGADVAKLVFLQVDPELSISLLKNDGSKISHGEIALTIQGKVASILKAERTALNFLQHLSGIATKVAEYVEKTKAFNQLKR